MRFPKFYYGEDHGLTPMDKSRFDRPNCQCRELFQTRKGEPVAVSMYAETGLWKVQFGFSTVLFSSRREAMDFCRKRFYDLSGRALKEG